MNVTFVINGQDFAPILSNYRVDHEVTYENVITTMDGTEHPIGEKKRTVILFSMLPTADADAQDYRALMQRPLIVRYTDPDIPGVHQKAFRLDCDLSKRFLLDSVDGHTYYKGGAITLRALGVD